MKTIPLPPESQVLELQAIPAWHLPQEVKFLCWLASCRVQSGLDVLEIGCDRGRLTRELALSCPSRKVYGQDYEPPGRLVGIEAAALTNVGIINAPALTLRYDELNLGLIFLDGDRSIPGVATDTIKAWDYFSVSKNPGFIVWHDANSEGVGYYLKNRFDPFCELTFVNGTWLALAGFNGAEL